MVLEGMKRKDDVSSLKVRSKGRASGTFACLHSYLLRCVELRVRQLETVGVEARQYLLDALSFRYPLSR